MTAQYSLDRNRILPTKKEQKYMGLKNEKNRNPALINSTKMSDYIGLVKPDHQANFLF